MFVERLVKYVISPKASLLDLIRTVNLFQDGVVRVWDSLLRSPSGDISVGRYIRSISFTAATEKAIETKLGRPYVGWIPIRTDTQVTFKESSLSATDRDKLLKLVPSATCVADILVW